MNTKTTILNYLTQGICSSKNILCVSERRHGQHEKTEPHYEGEDVLRQQEALNDQVQVHGEVLQEAGDDHGDTEDQEHRD